MFSLSSSETSVSSPVLFNSDTKMVDVIAQMKEGCSMVILECSKICDKTVDFQHFNLSKDNKTIQCPLKSKLNIRISDLLDVKMAREEEISAIHEFLDIYGLDRCGLTPIMLNILFKKQDGKSLTMIFDSISNANVWFHGLTKLINVKKVSSLKSFSIVVGNELESFVKEFENGEANEVASKGDSLKRRKSRFDFRNAAFVETIKCKMDEISHSIIEFESFCNAHCIFGSFDHLSLLNECQLCIELLKEIKHLISVNDENRQIFFSENNYDIYYLKENWYKLNTKLAIVCLKSLDLRYALTKTSETNDSNNNKKGKTDESKFEDQYSSQSSLLLSSNDSNDSNDSHGSIDSHSNDDENGQSETNVKKSNKVGAPSIYQIFESAIESH